MKQINIADRTLCRESGAYNFKEKLEIARRLEQLRVDVIELPEIKDERADTLLVKTTASFVKESALSVAANSEAGVKLAAEALQNAAKARLRVELPVSPACMEYQCHKKPPKMLEYIAKTVAAAAATGIDVEFCAVDAGSAEPDFLKEAIKAAVTAGAKFVTVCDDKAILPPDEFAAFTKELAESCGAPLGVLCGDRYGCACAAAVLAAKNGAAAVKTAVDGDITPLETFAGLLQARGEHLAVTTLLRYTELHRTARQIRWISDTSRGEKEASPIERNGEDDLKLDRNDDRAAVEAAAAKLGYDLSEEDSARVYEEFQRVAVKKTVGAKELDAIVASSALQVPATYKLISYVINSGNVVTASAQITLEKAGKTLQGVALGDGPVDAAFLAIEQIIGHHFELDDFQIQAVTEGKDSVGNAVVKLRSDGKLYSGSGISTDILGASIRAYLNAVNKIVYEEE